MPRVNLYAADGSGTILRTVEVWDPNITAMSEDGWWADREGVWHPEEPEPPPTWPEGDPEPERPGFVPPAESAIGDERERAQEAEQWWREWQLRELVRQAYQTHLDRAPTPKELRIGVRAAGVTTPKLPRGVPIPPTALERQIFQSSEYLRRKWLIEAPDRQRIADAAGPIPRGDLPEGLSVGQTRRNDAQAIPDRIPLPWLGPDYFVDAQGGVVYRVLGTGRLRVEGPYGTLDPRDQRGVDLLNTLGVRGGEQALPGTVHTFGGPLEIDPTTASDADVLKALAQQSARIEYKAEGKTFWDRYGTVILTTLGAVGGGLVGGPLGVTVGAAAGNAAGQATTGDRQIDAEEVFKTALFSFVGTQFGAAASVAVGGAGGAAGGAAGGTAAGGSAGGATAGVTSGVATGAAQGAAQAAVQLAMQALVNKGLSWEQALITLGVATTAGGVAGGLGAGGTAGGTGGWVPPPWALSLAKTALGIGVDVALRPDPQGRTLGISPVAGEALQAMRYRAYLEHQARLGSQRGGGRGGGPQRPPDDAYVRAMAQAQAQVLAYQRALAQHQVAWQPSPKTRAQSGMYAAAPGMDVPDLPADGTYRAQAAFPPPPPMGRLPFYGQSEWNGGGGWSSSPYGDVGPPTGAYRGYDLSTALAYAPSTPFATPQYYRRRV